MFSPTSYPLIYFSVLFLIIVFYSILNIKVGEQNILARSQGSFSIWGLLLSLLIILFLGFRPIDKEFVDTVSYAQIYENIGSKSASYFVSGDIGFKYFMLFLSSLGISVNVFIFLVEFVYIGCIVYICNKIFRQNSGISLVAIFSAFFFYDLGVNVIRNGMALSIVSLSIFLFEKRKYLWGTILGICAISIHISVLIVIGAYILGKFYNRPKVYLWGWVVCLIISIVVGRYFEGIISHIGFLSSWRSATYLSGENVDMSIFSKTGYRWDFLLFSLPPIIWIWYRIFKKKTTDTFFMSISNIYLIANSFWLLVNQSWLSNRIAYLSWFFYAIIFMYPLLRERNVPHRKLVMTLFLFGSISFSFIYRVF